MNGETLWSEFAEGFSVGTTGTEGGQILRDEEHAGGARVTLEEYGGIAPFSITCGIYDQMLHTRYFSTEREAKREFERMKKDLSKILELISTSGETDEDANEAIADEINSCVEKYP